jgi:general secretion pathway protein D
MHRTHRPSSFAAAVLAVAMVLAPAAAWAQPAGGGGAAAATGTNPPVAGEDASLYSCKKAHGKVQVSFKPDTQLSDLITWVMGFTCKNFIYDASITSRSKKITIISPVSMSAPQAYRVFLVALSTMGLTVVPKGNVLRIVEAGQAKSETLPIYRHGMPGNSDDMVRAILRPNYLSVTELNNALGGIKSPVGSLQPVAEANALIVTDYASTVRDMGVVMRELDQPTPSANIYTIKVKYADAKEIADKLNEILGLQAQQAAAVQSRGRGRAPVRGQSSVGSSPGELGSVGADDVASALPAKILSDDRTNTLIVLSNEAGYLRVKALVDRLDLQTELDAGGSIHVYPLQNADSEKLATTLNNALSGQGSTTPGSTRGQGGARGRAPAPRNPVRPAGSGDAGAEFEGQVHVTNDAPTNSLVIVSSGRDFLTLSDVIKRLDQPRRQVYIEAVILEVQLSNGLDLGTSFHGGASDGHGGVVIGGLQNSNLKSLDLTSLVSATGLIGGLIGAPLTDSEKLLGQSIPSYGVLFQALGKNSNTNILSEPHILTTDNEDSEISVGQNIPYLGGINFGGFGLPSSGTSGTGSTGIPSLGANIQRENLTLDMKIKPHVNGDDMVRLEIEQEIKDIGDKDPQLGPTWTTRKIKTSVVVRDQQTIVIGGLMQDRVIYNESKIPLLGDIPILGYLFKYTSKQKKKTNLLVLLTPYVIKDQFDLQRIVERKVRERAEFLASFHNLDDDHYLPRVDYRRKRGLVEEINRSVEEVEKEKHILLEFEQHGAQIPEGEIKYGVVAPDDGDGNGGPAPTPAGPAPAGPAPDTGAPAPDPTPTPPPPPAPEDGR